MLECKQNHRKKPRMLLVLNWYDLTQKFDCFSDSLRLGQVSLNPVWDKKIYSQRNISTQGSFLQNKPILLSPPFCSNSCRAGSNAVWHLWLKPVLSTINELYACNQSCSFVLQKYLRYSINEIFKRREIWMLFYIINSFKTKIG